MNSSFCWLMKLLYFTVTSAYSSVCLMSILVLVLCCYFEIYSKYTVVILRKFCLSNIFIMLSVKYFSNYITVYLSGCISLLSVRTPCLDIVHIMAKVVYEKWPMLSLAANLPTTAFPVSWQMASVEDGCVARHQTVFMPDWNHAIKWKQGIPSDSKPVCQPALTGGWT